MSVKSLAMSAAGYKDPVTYIEDVFSTYLYTGNGSTQTINNGIALADSPFYINMLSQTAVGSNGDKFYSVAINASGTAVAVGSNVNGYPSFSYTTNGTTWSIPAFMNGSTVLALMKQVVTTPNGFLAVGTNNSGYPVYATSTNGTTWTTPTQIIASTFTVQSLACSSSGTIIVCGRDNNNYARFMKSTNNGSTWTSPATFGTGDVSWAPIGIAVNSAGKFVVAGFDSIYYALFTTSTDGTTWTTPAAPASYNNVFDVHSVAVNSTGKFVMVGSSRGTQFSAMASSSSDGTTWTTPTTIPGTRFAMGDYTSLVIAKSSGEFTAFGFDNIYATMMQSSSADGVTWSTAQNNEVSSGYPILSAVYTNAGNLITISSYYNNGIAQYQSGSYYGSSVSAVTGKGGMVWIKDRTYNGNQNYVQDTVRGITNALVTNSTAASATANVSSASGTGFTLNSTYVSDMNGSGLNLVSWTFRKAPKFFDVVTYTGNGVAGRTVAHNLGQAPGMIIVKSTSAGGTNRGWWTYHRSLGSSYALQLENTYASQGASIWNYTNPSSTVFSVDNSYLVNELGTTYVAYLFAHDTTTDGLIQCGSFTTDSIGNATVNLGWESQYVLLKRTDTTGNWFVYDTMRGMSLTGINGLFPNTSDAEQLATGTNLVIPTATGFSIGSWLGFSATYIYMAIRRGPMRTPTDATKVFSALAATASTGTKRTTGFPVDLQIGNDKSRIALAGSFFNDRLRGVSTTSTASGANLYSSSTAAESTTALTQGFDSTGFVDPSFYSGYSMAWWNFRRAPGFFDIVCWEGDGTYERNIPHNLKVVPELVIVKNRKLADNWYVNGSYTNWSLGYPCMFLNLNSAAVGNTNIGIKNVTSTTFEVRHPSTNSNSATRDYVAYLFASCPGVSKIGSYTGNGTSQTINCGFSAGARFVLIKRTDSTGDWYVWDTARGIVAGNDPHLSLNTTAAEVTTNDSIDPDSTGFIVNQVTATNINVNAATYIYLAIA